MLSTLISAMALSTAPATEVNLTVYNQGFALVSEVRSIDLRQGLQQVMVEDVAQLIEPSSVGIRSLTDPKGFSILEQNYRYDLISPQAILAKAVGGRVVLNRVLPDGTKERIEGTLLSAPNQAVALPNGGVSTTGMVIRTDAGRILLDPSGEIEVASIPEGLISKPTLVWDIQAARAAKHDLSLSYITQGMGWTADYVLSLDKAGTIGKLQGWVTLTNNSGTTFTNAKLKLLAGDVNRVKDVMARGGFGGGAVMEANMAPGSMVQEQFGDYHLYTLQRPATVRNNEMKQLSLLEGIGVPVTRRLVLDPMRMHWGWRANEGEIGTGNLKPQILIEFKNDEASNLGMPMPAGTMKVFQEDSSGAMQLLGEDRIEHTPRNENLSFFVGRAFDVVAERKRTDFQWLRNRTGTRETFEIEIRNRKETSETVYLMERNWGQWEITSKNHVWEKLDANTIQFVVELKPDEVKKVVYTIETFWP